MGGGAWPFLVGGAICLVNSDNERDSILLNRWGVFFFYPCREVGVERGGCWESGRGSCRRAAGATLQCGGRLSLTLPPFASRPPSFLLRGIDGFQPHEREQ